MLGCEIGTTCCISSNSGWRQCCPRGTTCSEGRCVMDSCQISSENITACVNQPGCSWCCRLGQCQASDMAGIGCPGAIVATAQSQTCPDACNAHTSCDSCTRSGCDWCCSQSVCGSRGRTGCSEYSVLRNSGRCSVCASGGEGVVVVGDDVNEMGFYLFLAIIGCLVIFLMFLCTLVCRCLQHRLYIRRMRRLHALRQTLDGQPFDMDELIDFDESAASSKKHGFPPPPREDGSAPPNEPQGDIPIRRDVPITFPEQWGPAAQCVVCIDQPSVIYSSPCGHVALCVGCVQEIQRAHLNQLKVKWMRAGRSGVPMVPPPCPLCRKEMEHLVHLPSYLGPPHDFGFCSAHTIRDRSNHETEQCNCSDCF